LDPDNPIVKICVQGIQAEAQGNYDEARAFYTQAWQESTGDYEACIAAHFMARHQDDPHVMLYWNQEALRRAESLEDASVDGFYPSLYLNTGFSHERLGDQAEALRYYQLAAELIERLAQDAYGETVRQAIAEGIKRASQA